MRSYLFLPVLFAGSTFFGGVRLVSDSPRSAAGRPPAQAEPATSVPLFDDLGSHHHAVTTRSPRAQRYFDQGLRLVYAFNHDEARRAFAEAARLDPDLAMAEWGVALTLGPNVNLPTDPDRERAAAEAVRRALVLAGRASPAERDYIRALSVRYSASPGSDRRARDVAYADAMRDLSRRYPDDLDAATLFAEALMDLHPWTREGRPQPAAEEIVATLESVLARDPDHPGANHYYIHAVEASPHPERALASAERLGRLMPGAGHLVHMPSHVYMRLGRYAEARGANERAIAVDRAYIAAARPEGVYPMMYYPHNIHFLAVASAMSGRRAEALLAARELVDAVPDEAVRAMPMLEGFRAVPYVMLVRFGAWNEALAAPAPPADQRFTTAMWRWARGVALTRLGRFDEAAREQERFEAACAAVRGSLVQPADDEASALLSIASGVLAGEIAAARGRLGEAVSTLERAVRAEDALPYGEPPAWPLPVRHVLGAVLLAAGRPAEAEQVYREDLRHYPENGWSLYGLAESLERQGRRAEALAARERFERAFACADVTLGASRL